MSRREPFTLVEKMRLDDPTSDHAIVLKVIDEEWITRYDVILTLGRRDKRWTPDHVRAILNDLVAAGLAWTSGSSELPHDRIKYRRKHRA